MADRLEHATTLRLVNEVETPVDVEVLLEFKHPRCPRCPRCKAAELLYGGELPGERSTKPFTRLPTGDDDDQREIPEARHDDDEALDAELFHTACLHHCRRWVWAR